MDEIQAHSFFLAPGAFTTERNLDEEQLSFEAKAEHLADVIGERARRFASTLEDDIAHNLYRAWFIDFDPIRAWADERTLLPGIGPEEIGAFGAELVETPAGSTPQDWDLATVYDFAEVRYGRLLTRRNYSTRTEVGCL